jgi:transcriptional regulator with XRE-family HTH domain
MQASQQDNDLRARRRRAGLTQRALAVAAECSLSALRLYENGYSPSHSPTRERVECVLEELEQ